MQVLWTREDDTRPGHFQAASVHRLSAGFDRAGKLVRWRHTEAVSLHNLDGVEKPPTPNDAAFYQGYAWGVYDLAYAVPDLEMAYVPVDLPVRHGPWRAVFAPSAVFARESFIDELAQAQSADPLAFRLALLQGDEAFRAGDVTIERPRLRRVLETVWVSRRSRRLRPRSPTPSSRRPGNGFAGCRFARRIFCSQGRARLALRKERECVTNKGLARKTGELGQGMGRRARGFG